MALRPQKRLAQQSGHRLVSGPATEPVKLNAVRNLLRDPPVEENDFIEDCITQAREVFEATTGIACISQRWKLTLDNWPGATVEPWWDGMLQIPRSELNSGRIDYIPMPRYPLLSVDSLLTYDLDNEAASVIVADVFFIDTNSFPGRLVLNAGETWPTALRDRAAIEIEYTAGFGTSANSVPFSIKRAIQQVAGYMYENRGSGCSAQFAMSQTGALQIASEYVTVRL